MRLSEKTKGKEAGTEAKGGLPLLRAGGHADISASDTETEKILRHHDLYDRLEGGLLKYGFARCIEPDFDMAKWSEFQDSDLLLVRPQLVRFTNYKEMMALFQNGLPFFTQLDQNQRIVVLEQELQELKDRAESPTRQQAIRKEMNRVKSEKPEVTAEGIDLLAECLGIRLRVLPNRQNSDSYFVCNCDPTLFSSSSEFLKNQYGVNIEGPWTVLGQVNMHVTEAVDFQASGNQLEDLFDTIFSQNQQPFLDLTTVTYPVVSLTPICIYRETMAPIQDVNISGDSIGLKEKAKKSDGTRHKGNTGEQQGA